MRFTCPHCDKVYNGKPSHAGRKIRCKACDESFVVEAEDDDSDDDIEIEEAPPRRKRTKKKRRRAEPDLDAEPNDEVPTGRGLPPRTGGKKKPSKKKGKKKPKSKTKSDDGDGDDDDDEEAKPWQVIVGGVIIIGLTLFQFMAIANWERSDDAELSVFPGVDLVYNISGKFGVLITGLLIGGVAIISAFIDLGGGDD